MQKETIREAAQSQPFKPFALRLTDGTQVKVPHADFIFLAQGGRTLIVNIDGDNFRMIDASLITAIEFGPALLGNNGDPNTNTSKQ